MNELVKKFAGSKDEKELKLIVQDMVNLSSSFVDELQWRRPVMKIIIPFIADILVENIPAIVDGKIEPLTDGDVIEALDDFVSMAESSIEK